MKYIIRSSENGARIPLGAIEFKKAQAREAIQAEGRNYLEYSALLGTKDSSGESIAEEVTIIESVDSSFTYC